MLKVSRLAGHRLWSSLLDLLPVVAVVAFFQVVIIGQPLPDAVSLWQLLSGLFMVVAGLALFVTGLKAGLFPVGERLAKEFVEKGSITVLLCFGFFLGLGTTFAEPALLAVSAKAAEVVAEAGLLAADEASIQQFQFLLRSVVAASVGVAVLLGVSRIVLGWPLPVCIIVLYSLALLLTVPAPEEIVGIAFDSGGVTTSTITVPLLTALGVGLASTIKGRSPMLDGFGLIAFASVMPIIFVLLFGLVWL